MAIWEVIRWGIELIVVVGMCWGWWGRSMGSVKGFGEGVMGVGVSGGLGRGWNTLINSITTCRHNGKWFWWVVHDIHSYPVHISLLELSKNLIKIGPNWNFLTFVVTIFISPSLTDRPTPPTSPHPLPTFPTPPNPISFQSYNQPFQSQLPPTSL